MHHQGGFRSDPQGGGDGSPANCKRTPPQPPDMIYFAQSSPAVIHTCTRVMSKYKTSSTFHDIIGFKSTFFGGGIYYMNVSTVLVLEWKYLVLVLA